MGPERVKFYTDAHIAAAVTRALRREGVDIVRAYEAGLADADDIAHLEFALRENRVLVTQDSDFLLYHAQGRPHAGLAFFRNGAAVGYIIAELLMLHAVMAPEEMRDRLEYL